MASPLPDLDSPVAALDRWRRLALDVLRKAGRAGPDTTPGEAVDLLTTTGYDGVPVRPLYTAADRAPGSGVPGAFPFTRGSRPVDGRVDAGTPTWDVRQRHADPDPRVTAGAATADLENGVTSLWLVLGDGGVPVDALATALDGVHLDLAPVVLDAGAGAAAAARAFLALAERRGVPAGSLGGNLGIDPLGVRARTGADPGLDGTAAELARRCVAGHAGHAGHAGLRAMTVDATPYHEAGGSDAEELACAVATGVGYLRLLTDAGLDVTTALGQLEFRYAATADQFATIVKLRAARRLWARVAEACGAPADGGQRQHAVTSAAMMTARDPWSNLLRTTLACFGAGVGGADAVTVLPFDHRLGRPDAFARRIARNTQSLLLHEADVARVADPAGGSWYVERRTEDLAQRAWEIFTGIEKAGGMAAALDSGHVAGMLAATWDRRRANLAHRRDPVIGVSEFPNLGEPALTRPAAPAAAGGGLVAHHYAEDFEARRDLADAHTDRTGARPTVYLATLGPPAAHNARTAFAANLFAAGGIATGTGPVDGFSAAATPVACICGSDRSYAAEAATAARALAAAGATRIWLAGDAETPGVTGYVHSGCDVPAVLDDALRALGVTG